MSNFQWGNLRARVKRNVRLIMPDAIIGDENGNIYDPYLPGYVLVRQLYANGIYGPSFPVLGPAGTSVQLTPGTSIKLGQTSDGKLKVETYDMIGGSINGTNLLAPNVPQLGSGTFVGQQSIVTALVTPQNIPDLTVIIKSWPVIVAGTYYEFPGEPGFDLSSFVPSTGDNCFVVVFLDSDFLTPSAQASTPRSSTDLPLDAADIQECLDAASATSTPLAAIRLYGDQITIQNGDIIHDLRQLINTAGGAGGSLSVSDGSTTVSPVTSIVLTGATVTDGGGGEADVSISGGGAVYPKRDTMWHRASLVTAGNALIVSHDAAQDDGHYAFQNPAADGDTTTNSFMARTGTYDIHFLTDKDSNSGKIDVYIDSVNVGTIDQYAASQTRNSDQALTGISVTTDGYHQLKMVVNGKNGSSSNYFSVITRIWIVPSAD